MISIWEWIRFFGAAVLMLFGVFVFLSGIWGVFRFRFALNRMHAAGMIDTMGFGLCSLAMAVFFGLSWTSLKLILAVVILWCASPVSSHLIGRLVVATEERLEDHMEVRGK